MENFKVIRKYEVWDHLISGKHVYAVVLKSAKFNEGIKRLWIDWSVKQINDFLSDKEKNILFYEEVAD